MTVEPQEGAGGEIHEEGRKETQGENHGRGHDQDGQNRERRLDRDAPEKTIVELGRRFRNGPG